MSEDDILQMMKQKKVSWTVRISILVVVLVILGIGSILWWTDGTSAVDQNDKEQIVFSVDKGEGVREIAGRLAAERLIRSRTVFFLLIKQKGIDNKIQAGEFHLNRTMSADDVAETLTHGASDVKITTLEGWRSEEIAEKLSQELKIPEQEFLAVAQEGYMFPDTYLIPKDASAGAVVSIFKNTFNTRFTPQMVEAAQREGLTPKQVVILASLVEREGKTKEDKPVIAGILLNRIKEDMSLDVDATLQYALGYQITGKTWWKKELTDLDKKIDSPYNTYLHTGLPPAPISNPGLDSLTAVVNPTKSDYLYYLHDLSGQVHYAKTLKEHEMNISKYL